MYERMQKATIFVDGMHCRSCVAAVSSALRRLPSVRLEHAGLGEVTVMHDPAASPRGALVAAIERAGYRVAEHRGPVHLATSGCRGSRHANTVADARLASRAQAHRKPR